MEYSSLDYARFETRFLRLDAPIGDADDQLLRFDVEIGSVSKPPEFQALSYCWGKEPGKAKILIGTTEIDVSTNLEAALRSSALAADNRIWKDPHEKAYQVGMMGEIYSRDTKVIAWLGVEAPYLHAAAGLVNKFTSQYKRDRLDLNLEERRSPKFHRIFDEALAQCRNPIKALGGLTELFNRSYWERVWIIQEVAKASMVIVRCGDLVIDLHTLLRLRIYCRELPNRTQNLLAAISKFRAQELRNMGRMSLVQALTMSRYSMSTDERDKVYAILGIAGDSASLVPLPTYAASTSEVFEDLTRKIMESHQLSNVLILARRSPLVQRVPSASPWCVDWAQLEFSIPEWVARSSFSANGFQQHRHIFMNSTLHVKGSESGCITSHERVKPSKRHSVANWKPSSSFDVIKDLALNIINRLSRSKISPASANEEALVYALSRMLSAEQRSMESGDCDSSQIGPVLRRLEGVEIGETSDDSFQIGPVLRRLGGVEVGEKSVFEWAADANYSWFKRLAKTTKTVGDVEQKSRQNLTYSTKGKQPFSRLLKSIAKPSSDEIESNTLFSEVYPEVILHAEKIWETILREFSGLTEMQLQFAVLEDRSLILVPRTATTGDCVYFLSNCALNVVLQIGRNGDFRCLGEAYIERNRNGDWTVPQRALYKTIKIYLGD